MLLTWLLWNWKDKLSMFPEFSTLYNLEFLYQLQTKQFLYKADEILENPYSQHSSCWWQCQVWDSDISGISPLSMQPTYVDIISKVKFVKICLVTSVSCSLPRSERLTRWIRGYKDPFIVKLRKDYGVLGCECLLKWYYPNLFTFITLEMKFIFKTNWSIS